MQLLRSRRLKINNLKESIRDKKPNDCAEFASEKIGLWDLILLIYAFVVTVIYTVAPLVRDVFFSNYSSQSILVVYIAFAAGFIGFAVWAYIRKGNYTVAQKEFVIEERNDEVERIRNKAYEEELEEQLSSFASIVNYITIEQHNGNKSSATYAQIVANHLFLECQRRFGKDISVSIYDMNEKEEVCMKAFSTKIQRIDKPDLYNRGVISIYDKSIADRFYVLCLIDTLDEMYDLPNKKAIKTAFGFRNKKKRYSYNQYISFKIKTENGHVILIEVIAHNNTFIGKDGQLRDVAADMMWRYGLLIQNYWSLIAQ